MKKLGKLLGLAVILVVLLVVSVFGLIDRAAEVGLEKGASYALGVKTSADGLSLSILRGDLTLDSLKVSNPEGFETPHLMLLGKFDLGIVPKSVMSDTIQIERFEIHSLDINIEQKASGSNISTIMDNLKKFDTGSKDKPDSDKPKSKGKKVTVDRILITDVVAHFHMLPGILPGGPVTVKIPKIELKDVATGDNKATIAELFRKTIPAILAAVLEQSDQIPSDALADMEGQLNKLSDALSAQAGEAIKKASESLGESLKNIFTPKKTESK